MQILVDQGTAAGMDRSCPLSPRPPSPLPVSPLPVSPLPLSPLPLSPLPLSGADAGMLQEYIEDIF